MNRRLKTLGLALIAVFAFGAMTASGASAAKVFHATAPADLTGKDIINTKFTIHGVGATECATTSYSGTQTVTHATEVKITPSYAGCTTEGFTTHVAMNGCTYVFTLHAGLTSTGGATTHTHGPVHIACPVGQTITLTITGFFGSTQCIVHIGAQTPTSSTVDYKNKGAGTTEDVEVTSTINGVAYNLTNVGFPCPVASKVGHDATFSGSGTLQGYKHKLAHTEANHVGVRISET